TGVRCSTSVSCDQSRVAPRSNDVVAELRSTLLHDQIREGVRGPSDEVDDFVELIAWSHALPLLAGLSLRIEPPIPPACNAQDRDRWVGVCLTIEFAITIQFLLSVRDQITSKREERGDWSDARMQDAELSGFAVLRDRVSHLVGGQVALDFDRVAARFDGIDAEPWFQDERRQSRFAV